MSEGNLPLSSPIDGESLGYVEETSQADAHEMISKAKAAFLKWRVVPAPLRGEHLRLLGEELRTCKEELGYLISLESGKILEEGRGEVQEIIDICGFALGLSRQLYGLTMTSERPGHRMMETWHPLGPVAVISPFNFPAAIWGWNFVLAILCGNPVIWKPSEKTLLTAIACAHLFEKVISKFENAPPHLLQLALGGREISDVFLENHDIPLVSATGSCGMGHYVAQQVSNRLGRYLLELGGNNGMILAPSAHLELAVRAVTFSALGTAGQRCTTLRRLIIHRSIYDQVIPRLKSIFENVKIGNPLESGILMGPLINKEAYEHMQESLKLAQEQGGKIHGGTRVLKEKYTKGYYVKPALVEMPSQTSIVKTETFAPILYVMTYDDFTEALQMHNDVPQGLSSSIFTQDTAEAEIFMSASGSDCGIVNVNIGPSGAEIGGAFGGEKETGGGRVSGTDTWRAFMRRATNTINYSGELPLAQGIHFDVS
ncbi:aldehyde dehydrogenase family protein [Candidatus Bealeia paramacronuclearis]